MGLWDALGVGNVRDAVSTGLNLAGNVLQSRQVSNATRAQTDAANRALDLQSNIYQQQRADLAPYRGLGTGAAQLLSRGVGLQTASDTTIPAFQQQPMGNGPQVSAQMAQAAQRNPNAYQAVPRSLASLGGDGFVNMLTPDGRPARVPQAQVRQALAAGGRMA